MKTGDIIKIENEDHIKIIKELIKENQTAQTAFHQASQMLKMTSETMWGTINELFPKAAEFEMTLNNTTLELQLRHKKRKLK